MPENRNLIGGPAFDSRGSICIDANRVFDCCRDRDCFEDARVFLTAEGEQIIGTATSVRTKEAEILWTYVGVDEVPFNNGFYQITVRYYVAVECEACLGIGRSSTLFGGLAILEKKVILYGGEGKVTSFSSSPENNYCTIGDFDTVGSNEPTAVVEVVEPVVLSTRVTKDCFPGDLGILPELPEGVKSRISGALLPNPVGEYSLRVSFGVFSVVRIERPAQLLVDAQDYSVPEKECPRDPGESNPCALFHTIAFPESQFRGVPGGKLPPRSGGCLCGGNK